MRLCLLLTLAIACSCYSTTRLQASDPASLPRGKAFFIQHTKDGQPYRNGASHRLVINGTQLAAVGSLDVASKEWKEIHAAVDKLRTTKGCNKLLHIQYFFERGTQPRHLRETKVATKVALADIDIYIACIDGQYRGDDTKWSNGE